MALSDDQRLLQACLPEKARMEPPENEKRKRIISFRHSEAVR